MAEDFEEKLTRGMNTVPPPTPEIAAIRLVEMLEPMAKSKQVTDGMATLTLRESDADWLIYVVAGMGKVLIDSLSSETPKPSEFGKEAARLFGLDAADPADLRVMARGFRQSPVRKYFIELCPTGELNYGDREKFVNAAADKFPDFSLHQIRAAFDDWKECGS